VDSFLAVGGRNKPGRAVFHFYRVRRTETEEDRSMITCLAAGVAALALAVAPVRADDDKPKPGRPGATKPGDGKPGAGQPGRRGNPEQMFKRLDTDGDGKLSAEEFKKIAERGQGRVTTEMADRMFTRLDKNKDGSLTLDELKEVGAGRGKRKPGGEKP
jgi:hypothetical protein